MKRCLYLAKKAFPACMPNPAVGAVVVYNNRIVGEGYTQAYGGAHAEVMCINAVSNKSILSESTLYVSLEPCSHYGKTPPCADLIVKYNLKRVVIGCLDTHSLVLGKGVERLQKAKVQVTIGIEEKACIELNRRFFRFQETQRPYIILKWAQTKKGFFAPKENQQFWITNNYAKQLNHQWRSEEQAILIGNTTALIDNPKLNVREVDGVHPVRVILGVNNIGSNSELFSGETETLVYSDRPLDLNRPKLTVKLLKFDEHLLKHVLADLTIRNIQSVIIEGGKYTLEQFINQNLWDECRILIGNKELKTGISAPKIDGELITQFKVGNNNCTIYKNNRV